MKCDYRDAAVAALYHEGKGINNPGQAKPRAMTMTHASNHPPS